MDNGINSSELAELYGEFVDECRELAEAVYKDLVLIEKDPSNEELVNGVFRSLHTIKGNAGFIGLGQLSELAHSMENVLGMVREGELVFTADINDVLFKALDIVRGLLDDFLEGSEDERDLDVIFAELDGLLHRSTGVGEADKETGVKAEAPVAGDRRLKKREAVFYARVSTARLDKLVNLAGELAAGRSRLDQLSKTIKDKSLDEVSAFISTISTQIQDEVLSIRMVPISQLFNKFYRLVRDISKTLGKQVDLKVVGEETELDKTFIEELHDPILHMVRNAVDHGIGTPAERKRLGKPAVGTITLRAYHQQNQICVDVEDDGMGVDVETVREKALARGILKEDEVEALDRGTVLRIISTSGFSTTAEVDDLSGRGVGMDVVKTNIEKLGGTIGLDFKKDAYTKFTLKMPLTLAIVHLFLLKEAGQTYGIPLSYVDRTIRVGVDEIEHIKGQMVFMLRHHPITIVSLGEVLGRRQAQPEGDNFFIVILSLLGKKVGFIVDGFEGKVETVIKSLGNYIKELPRPIEGISGASILGSGEVVLVIDVPSLYKII